MTTDGGKTWHYFLLQSTGTAAGGAKDQNKAKVNTPKKLSPLVLSWVSVARITEVIRNVLSCRDAAAAFYLVTLTGRLQLLTTDIPKSSGG